MVTVKVDRQLHPLAVTIKANSWEMILAIEEAVDLYRQLPGVIRELHSAIVGECRGKIEAANTAINQLEDLPRHE